MYERIQFLKNDVYIIHILRLMKEIFHFNELQSKDTILSIIDSSNNTFFSVKNISIIVI